MFGVLYNEVAVLFSLGFLLKYYFYINANKLK